MLLHNDTFFCLYFGDKSTSVTPEYLHDLVISDTAPEKNPLNTIVQALQLRRPIMLKQVHGVQGYSINSEAMVKKLSKTIHEGDFLITNIPDIGIGIITADCLPLVMYDKKKNVLGIAHAGWKGSIEGISQKLLDKFAHEYTSNFDDLSIFLGPSARDCCYEVKNDFVKTIEHHTYGPESLVFRKNKIYFDITGFNKRILQKAGIPETALCEKYNLCTVCNPTFCSVRRERITPYRHITLATLRKNS